MQVCLPPPAPAPLPNFAGPQPWATGVTYALFTNNSINGVNNVISATGTADIANVSSASYVQAPIFNIIDLGPNKGLPAGEVYQVDAVGFGGTTNTVAVVESTFVVGSNTPSNLGNP